MADEPKKKPAPKKKAAPKAKVKPKSPPLTKKPVKVKPKSKGEKIAAMKPNPALAHITYTIPGGTATPPHDPK